MSEAAGLSGSPGIVPVRATQFRAGLIAVAMFAALLPESAPTQSASDDGFHATPSLYWKSGDHRLDLGLALRVRTEYWDAFSDDEDWYTGVRTRVRFGYAYRERILVAAEIQDLRLDSLGPDASGAEQLYRAAADGRHRSYGTDLRQLFLELRPLEKGFLRVGRQDLKLGNEVPYPEPDWSYLKSARIGERLVGTVGWSQAERSNDGLAAGIDLGKHHLFVFGAHPTTGVFDPDDAYQDQQDIAYGGGAFTVKRGSVLESTELSAFAIGYDDDRSPDDGGLPGGVEVYTLGAHWLGIYPLGPGKLDVLLWAAGQLGDYDDLDHEAAALVAEVGYGVPETRWKPWLRLGVNAASGDDDPGDGEHGTFFNLLPTNHLYYGFADQLALQNLVDRFVQLRLEPHEVIALNLFLHRFGLAEDDDGRYSGTGAFDKQVFGFRAQPSRGYAHVGTEYDAVATLKLHRNVTLELGYAFFDGGALFRTTPDRDLHWFYASVELRY